jgi:hypothetical protein
VLLGLRQTSGIAQDHGSRAEINRDATLGTVQTMTGNVAQDYSRKWVSRTIRCAWIRLLSGRQSN